MLTRRFGTSALLVVAACGTPLVVPEVPDTASMKTEILLIGIAERPEPGELIVIDLAAPRTVRFTLPDDPYLEAFFSKRSPFELGLEPGRYASLNTGTPIDPVIAFRANLEDEAHIRWAPIENPEWANRVRIPFTDALFCIRSKGCVVDGYCQKPCTIDVQPAPPVPPEVPRMTCPTGWTSEVIATVDSYPGAPAAIHVCEPWPGGTSATCAAGEAQFPGQPTCLALGTACPSGTFPPDDPGRPRVYVATQTVPPEDGTRDNPFTDVRAAIAAAGVGDTVMLATGDYDVQDLVVERPLTLAGVCPTAVRISGSLDLRSNGIAIHDLTVVGPVIVRAVTASLRGVEIDDAIEFGIEVTASGSVDIDHVSVRGEFRRALVVRDSAGATGSFLAINGATESSIVVTGLPGATLSDVAIENSGAASIRASRGAHLAVTRGVFERGVGAEFEDATFDLTDVVFRGTGRQWSITSSQASTGTVTRAWVVGANRAAIGVVDRSDVLIRDMVVSDGVVNGASNAVWGRDAVLAIERIAIVRTPAVGINMLRTPLRITDLIVHRSGTRGDVDGTGLYVVDTERLEATRVHLSHIPGSATYIANVASAQFVDVDLVDVGDETCTECSGLCVRKDGALELTRFRAREAKGTPLYVDPGWQFDASDITITNVMPSVPCAVSGNFGNTGDGMVLDGIISTIDSFRVDTCSSSGVNIVSTQFTLGRIVLTNGVVRGCSIGLSLGIEKLSVDDLTERVNYIDNDLPFASSFSL